MWTEIEQENKLCVFTRPFILPELKNKKFIKLSLTKMNDEKNKKLVENLLAEKSRSNDKIFDMICIFLNLNDNLQHFSLVASTSETFNDFKTPL